MLLQQQPQQGAGSNQVEEIKTQPGEALEAGCLPVVSRRKLSIGGGEGVGVGVGVGVGDDSAERVHPSLKRFHWTVTNMVEVADELIFRKIVSYL